MILRLQLIEILSVETVAANMKQYRSRLTEYLSLGYVARDGNG